MTRTHDLALDDGRTLRFHDAGTSSPDPALTILWHHGSPQTGAPLEPLVRAAAQRGIRLVSYARPGYGGSTTLPGRDVASAAVDAGRIVDTLGIGTFAVMGASGGGPHALACAAGLPGRVTGVAVFASPAPYTPHDTDWFAGMAGDGAALRAALLGREARVEFERTAEFDEESFNDRDYGALRDRWQSLAADVESETAAGWSGLIDDDLALVAPWGFDVSSVGVPVLLAQGGDDRVIPEGHARRLLDDLPDGELWLRPRDGHIAVLDAHALAMDWLLAGAADRLRRA
jgi:pimeloyl-ACP methyl ester carboxylesterase